MKNLKDAMVVAAFMTVGVAGSAIREIPGLVTEAHLLAEIVSIIGYAAGGYYLAFSGLLREAMNTTPKDDTK